MARSRGNGAFSNPERGKLERRRHAPTDEPPQKPEWPGRVAERVKLVKAALSATPLTATELSARFTGADESSITETLDALVELELATRTTSGHYSR